MKKAIIFGCGKIGLTCYNNIHEDFSVVAWADNREELWGQEQRNIKIISPSSIMSEPCYKDVVVFIAVEDKKSSDDILYQLDKMGISEYYIWRNPFFYYSNKMLPYQSKHLSTSIVEGGGKSVLFVSSKAGIRDHKAAELIRNEGWKVYLAYFIDSPVINMPEYVGVYENIYLVHSFDEISAIIEGNDFDIIHCSSEPLFLVPCLKKCGKKIVLDVHDLDSMTRPEMSPESLMLENLAHTLADGVIYPNEALRKAAIERFGISEQRTCVVGNYVSRRMKPSEYKKKISSTDGQLHAVYEGLITSTPRNSKKFLEDIWLKIADAGVNVHFYSSYDLSYCMYLDNLHQRIHYEGNLSSMQLAVEMTKYDVGLCFFNDNPMTHPYLKHSLGLKQYEYINAGIPIAVGDMPATIEFVKKYDIGDYVDLDGDILNQMVRISRLNVPTDFLDNNRLFLEDNGEVILHLYEKILNEG